MYRSHLRLYHIIEYPPSAFRISKSNQVSFFSHPYMHCDLVTLSHSEVSRMDPVVRVSALLQIHDTNKRTESIRYTCTYEINEKGMIYTQN